MEKRLLLPMLFLVALSAAADPFLLQSENVGRTDHLGLELSTEGGYEGGFIPDWFVSHRLGLGLFDSLGIDLEATWGGFPDQDQVRLDSASMTARYGLVAGSALDLQLYLKDHGPGPCRRQTGKRQPIRASERRLIDGSELVCPRL